jgi:hypothetical protein
MVAQVETLGHRSLILYNIPAGEYDVTYEVEGYNPLEFDITVTPTGSNTFTRNLLPIAKGVIDLDAPATIIPSEVFLDEPADFTFQITNTGTANVEYAIRIEFESVDLPDQISFLFPANDSELIWSDGIPSSAHTVNYATVALPESAIPIGEDEATFNVYVRLLAR